MEVEQIQQGPGFIKHVFNFDNETKSTLINVLQYLVIAVVPIVLLGGLVDSFIPEADESKNNFEILAETLGHSFAIIVMVILVNRIVTYVPTYSGRAYEEINIFTILVVLTAVLFSTKNKISDKMKILFKRANELWNGKKEEPQKKQNNVKVSQPISGMQQAQPTHQPSRADYVQTHNVMTADQPSAMGQIQQQQNINNVASHGASNNMYNNNGFNGLVDAMSPVMSNEPMAANSFGGFSSW